MQGILMTPDNHKAILERRKFQTRRLDHLKEINKNPNDWWLVASFDDNTLFRFANDKLDKDLVIKPRYHTGNVYIKEAWATDKMFDSMTAKSIERMGVATIPLWYKYGDSQSDREGQVRGRWRSPMFLPEWAARDFIKFHTIFPQRAQEITLAQAIAEGFDSIPAFGECIDRINPEHPFANNFWLFVYEFTKLDKHT